jgi:uncharacterized membrane protein YtjA (UPF0391 family)
MLSWAIIFLVIALIAGILGFGGVAIVSIELVKIVFFVAIVLFAISAVAGLIQGRGTPGAPRRWSAIRPSRLSGRRGACCFQASLREQTGEESLRRRGFPRCALRRMGALARLGSGFRFRLFRFSRFGFAGHVRLREYL